MAEAYKLKADASFPEAIRQIDELVDGQKLYETVGRNYVEGSYVLAEQLSPPIREQAENGDLDHLLEPAGRDEAVQAQQVAERGVFIPEHEAERVVLQEFGHETVPRQQVLELRSAGADAAREAVEAAKDAGVDERPAITASEVPSLAEAAVEGKTVVATDEEPVDEEKLEGVEQPPGLLVGDALESAEGGEEAAPAPRERPKRQAKEAKRKEAVEEQAKSE